MSDAGKSWPQESVVCSRCQVSKIDLLSKAGQWRVMTENISKEGYLHSTKKKFDDGWKRACHMTRFWTFHVRVSWSLLFDALLVYFLSDVWETLHDDSVSLNRRCCFVCDKRCHYQTAYERNQFTEPVIAKNSKAISLLKRSPRSTCTIRWALQLWTKESWKDCHHCIGINSSM